MLQMFQMMFQSRNRGSFDFKPDSSLGSISPLSFQSRNRGSFDFKTLLRGVRVLGIDLFQSRNRGSFDFKRRNP